MRETILAFNPVPWRTEYLWTLDGDGGIWRGHTRPYLLVNVTMAGDTIRTIRREEESVPVTPAERDSVLARLDSFSGLPISAQADLIPEAKPAITALHTSAGGDLWVRRWWADTEPGSRFDVYSPDGRLRGSSRRSRCAATGSTPSYGTSSACRP